MVEGGGEGRGGEGEGGGGGGGGDGADVKSNNPHLTGGEKCSCMTHASLW